MITDTFKFKGSDGKEIFSHKWLPENGTKLQAIVQIAHGMAEHSARYQRFAEMLTENNFGVYAHDHRGHGQTAGTIENLGYFADNNGWDLVVSDMNQLTKTIKNNHRHVPVFLFGHSMGSFLSRDYIFTYPGNINGVILSATACDPGLLGYVGIIISKIEGMLRGRKAQSPLMNSLSFGSFNKPFKPNRTDFDWLSRDNAEVDKYIDDPFCGTVFKAGFFNDLVKGIKKINKPSNINSTPKDLPVFFIAGSNDPVGDFSKGVKKVYQDYEKAGMNNLSIKFYEDGRHEMLNETNRKEVFKDIINWLEQCLSK
ncbi:MAG: alpha/beta hydrolase [Desulfobacteraceae bacterium]|nr:alpha/beta hydrolase [Desulfobacteraceae bacterium]